MNLPTFDMNVVAQIIGSITSLITVIIALYTLSTAFRFRSELALSEQIANVPDILSEDYLNRKFIPPLIIDDRKIHTIREARLLAQIAMKPNGIETDNEAKERFLQSTLLLETWQNKFAYEVSLGLERVGLMILSGGLPANYVFEDAGLLIIEDWGYCSKLVPEVIRRGPSTLKPKEHKDGEWMGLQRGHGEWLVYASVLYVSKNWKGEYLQNLIQQIGDLDTIRQREKLLRNFYSDIIPRATNKNIRRLIS